MAAHTSVPTHAEEPVPSTASANSLALAADSDGSDDGDCPNQKRRDVYKCSVCTMSKKNHLCSGAPPRVDAGANALAERASPTTGRAGSSVAATSSEGADCSGSNDSGGSGSTTGSAAGNASPKMEVVEPSGVARSLAAQGGATAACATRAGESTAEVQKEGGAKEEEVAVVVVEPPANALWRALVGADGARIYVLEFAGMALGALGALLAPAAVARAYAGYRITDEEWRSFFTCDIALEMTGVVGALYVAMAWLLWCASRDTAMPTERRRLSGGLALMYAALMLLDAAAHMRQYASADVAEEAHAWRTFVRMTWLGVSGGPGAAYAVARFDALRTAAAVAHFLAFSVHVHLAMPGAGGGLFPTGAGGGLSLTAALPMALVRFAALFLLSAVLRVVPLLSALAACVMCAALHSAAHATLSVAASPSAVSAAVRVLAACLGTTVLEPPPPRPAGGPPAAAAAAFARRVAHPFAHPLALAIMALALAVSAPSLLVSYRAPPQLPAAVDAADPAAAAALELLYSAEYDRLARLVAGVVYMVGMALGARLIMAVTMHLHARGARTTEAHRGAALLALAGALSFPPWPSASLSPGGTALLTASLFVFIFPLRKVVVDSFVIGVAAPALLFAPLYPVSHVLAPHLLAHVCEYALALLFGVLVAAGTLLHRQCAPRELSHDFGIMSEKKDGAVPPPLQGPTATR